MREGGFSASVNYRRTERGDRGPVKALMENVRRGLAGCWPVSFLLRQVFEECSDFTSAVYALSSAELVVPTYVTLCGIRPGEGAVITRDRQGTGEAAISARLATGKPLVQVNMDLSRVDNNDSSDDWQDIEDSRLR